MNCKSADIVPSIGLMQPSRFRSPGAGPCRTTADCEWRPKTRKALGILRLQTVLPSLPPLVKWNRFSIVTKVVPKLTPTGQPLTFLRRPLPILVDAHTHQSLDTSPRCAKSLPHTPASA